MVKGKIQVPQGFPFKESDIIGVKKSGSFVIQKKALDRFINKGTKKRTTEQSEQQPKKKRAAATEQAEEKPSDWKFFLQVFSEYKTQHPKSEFTSAERLSVWSQIKEEKKAKEAEGKSFKLSKTKIINLLKAAKQE